MKNKSKGLSSLQKIMSKTTKTESVHNNNKGTWKCIKK